MADGLAAVAVQADAPVDVTEGIDRAAAAAKEGMLATAKLKSRVGRASWFSDRTEGIQDPGATAVYLMIRSLNEYVAEAK